MSFGFKHTKEIKIKMRKNYLNERRKQLNKGKRLLIPVRKKMAKSAKLRFKSEDFKQKHKAAMRSVSEKF